jgi:AraC-like DNA-binding protein
MAKRYTEQDQKIFETGRPLLDSLDLTVFNNRRRGWCLTTKHPLRNRKGEIIGLTCLSKDLVESSNVGFVDEELSAAIDYIRDHFSDNLTLEQLAKMANLSVSQLDRRIKRIFNVTTGQFIIKTRVDAVARQLLESEKPAGMIAVDCGFCDQSAMSKQFRQVTGFTPSAYRKYFR